MFPKLQYQHVFSEKGKEFIECCREIVAAEKLNAGTFNELRRWLRSNADVAYPAVTFVRMLANKISQDHRITGNEAHELLAALKHYTAEAERLSEDNDKPIVNQANRIESDHAAVDVNQTGSWSVFQILTMVVACVAIVGTVLAIFLVVGTNENPSLEQLHVLIAPAGILLAFLCLGFSITGGRRHRLVNDIPTSKVLGVFIGLVELKGTCESERPLRSYLAECLCAQYSFTIQEHWSYTETYTDKEGKTKTRRRSGWSTVGSGDDMRNFYLRDETGVLLVRPAGAKIEGRRVFSQTCGPGNPVYYGKGPSNSVMHSDFRRRFTETALPLHAELYIMGAARERDDVVAPEIAHNPEAEINLISTRREEQVSSSFRWQFWGLGLLGSVTSVGGLAWGDGMAERSPLIWAYVAVGVSYVGLWGLSWIVMVYNSIVGLRNRVRTAWAQIDIQLKRRADLIPNLVKIIGGYRKHEAQTQETIAALRSQQGDTGLNSAACQRKVIALAEAYPELKSNQLFLKLQKQLIETEDRIALARAYFNDIVTSYNTRLEVVPDCLIAKLGVMKPESLMEINGFEAKPIVVNLCEDDDGPIEEVPEADDFVDE